MKRMNECADFDKSHMELLKANKFGARYGLWLLFYSGDREVEADYSMKAVVLENYTGSNCFGSLKKDNYWKKPLEPRK